MGGVNVDRNSVRELQESRTAAVRSLENSLQAITELGVQVKDLDTGLVDFPTLYRGGEALLCWRLARPESDSGTASRTVFRAASGSMPSFWIDIAAAATTNRGASLLTPVSPRL